MNPINDHTLPLEKRIESLLTQLTINEKIRLLPSRQSAIKRLGIPAYNVCAEGAHGLLVRKKHEQWPSGNSTVFPQPIGLSCTWDKDLLHRVGDVISTEARIWYEIDKHTMWLTIWSPTIDMERDPRWGRNEEGYGEDPYLAGKLSSAFIRGVQGDHPYYLKAACSVKHFYGNNMEKDRGFTSTNISERVKHEYYLKVFKYAFTEGKAHSFMAAYNEINGVPCLINPENVDIVKKQWGCDGYIVSDGDDLPQMVTLHHYCKLQSEAIALALKAGADVFPVQKNTIVTTSAHAALKKGLITEKDIDRAVGSIFATRFRLGHFDSDEANPYASIRKDKLCCKEHLQVSLEASHKSVVMLKNDGILPLCPEKNRRVLVLGDLAKRNMPDWYSGKPLSAVSPLEAISSALPESKVDTVDIHDLCVIYSKKDDAWLRVKNDGSTDFDGTEETRTVFEEIDWGFNAVSYRNVRTKKYLNVTGDLKLGCTSDDVWGWFTTEQFFRNEKTGKFLPHSFIFMNRYGEKEKKAIDKMVSGMERQILTNGIAPAAGAAEHSDTVVIMLGNHPLINGRECFDRPSIEFPKRWKELIKSIHEVNKNVILVLIAGYPYAFPKEEKLVRAVLYTAHGEEYVGRAVADTLMGVNNPAGRLSQTWYKYEKDLPPMDNYDIINSPRTYMYFEGDVQYPFGYGLSYTKFSYADMKVTGKKDGSFTVSCTVTNTGKKAGDEVAQLYAVLGGVPVKAPNKKLVGFERIHLGTGKSETVTFDVPAEELRLYDEDKAAFSIVPESVTFLIGASSEDIRLELNRRVL